MISYHQLSWRTKKPLCLNSSNFWTLKLRESKILFSKQSSTAIKTHFIGKFYLSKGKIWSKFDKVLWTSLLIRNIIKRFLRNKILLSFRISRIYFSLIYIIFEKSLNIFRLKVSFFLVKSFERFFQYC